MATSVNYSNPIEQIDYEPAFFSFKSDSPRGRYADYVNNTSVWLPESKEANDHGFVGVLYSSYGVPYISPRLENESIIDIQNKSEPLKRFIDPNELVVGQELPLLGYGAKAFLVGIEEVTSSFFPIERFRIKGLVQPLARYPDMLLEATWLEDGTPLSKIYNPIDISNLNLNYVYFPEVNSASDIFNKEELFALAADKVQEAIAGDVKEASKIDINLPVKVVLTDTGEVVDAKRVRYRKSTDRISAIVPGQYGYTLAYYTPFGEWVGSIDSTTAQSKLIN